ncbi:GH25 family lysozyme [Sinomonas sp. P10A9]|uniref:lysozyme n=1 Tax=Sinomonas puerhi TaxID=3238584 RepID=A0AB39KZA9_9MICC
MAVRIPLASTWQPSWGVAGVDVSSWQASNGTDTVDWPALWNQGARFAYVKATEGNYYTSASWGQQYGNSQNAGMLRGSYHFAIPNWSSGADQATYFAHNGGGWSPDGITMPPALDIEYNPYAGRTINGVYMGNTCYSLSADQMVQWISDFSNTMVSLTGRRPVIYSTTDWWSSCTGNSAALSNNPLWIAAYNTSGPGTLPASWSNFSIWQYSSDGPFAGDSNVWNGDFPGLQRFATYGDTDPSAAFGRAAPSANLGDQTSGIVCTLSVGGCYQGFQNGALVWSRATGVQPSPNGPIRTAWAQTGYDSGPLGYPTSSVQCVLTNNGCYQGFQNGVIVWSKDTGAQLSLNGPIRTAWAQTGYDSGPLGYPISSVQCVLTNNGCYQGFQNGVIVWSKDTGAQLSLNGPIRTAWAQTGYDSGPLGYPTGPESCGLRDGGCYQAFQGGEIMWSTATGAQISHLGGIRTAYRAAGAEGSVLGYPTGPETCGLRDGGCYQAFQGGEIMWSTATGAQISHLGGIRTAYRAAGAEGSVLGYPTGPETCGLRDGGCYQAFQGGEIMWSTATGAQISHLGGIRTAYRAAGAEGSVLGYPTGPETCGLRDGGCYQAFQGGEIMWSTATGAQISHLGGIRTAYRAAGAEGSVLGYPTGPETCGLRDGGCYQAFQGGEIMWSTATGAQISHLGGIRTAYRAAGAEGSVLGYPTGPETCGLRDGGCYQAFQGGEIMWSTATGAQISPNGPIRNTWVAAGSENGRYGYPTGGESCNSANTNCNQMFQGGSISWDSVNGVR